MNSDILSKIISSLPLKEKIISEQSGRESAVLIPLIEKNEELYILFEKRSKHVSQPGEICFPGGRVDEEDGSLEEAVIRETEEELGYPPHHIEILGKSSVMASHRNLLHAYVGYIHWDEVKSCRFNHYEVEDIHLVSLDRLLGMEPKTYKIKMKAEIVEEDHEGNIRELLPAEKLNLPESYHGGWDMGYRPIIAYEMDHMIIWGLTAYILKDFLEDFKKEMKK